eukprot:gene9845-2168_t
MSDREKNLGSNGTTSTEGLFSYSFAKMMDIEELNLLLVDYCGTNDPDAEKFWDLFDLLTSFREFKSSENRYMTAAKVLLQFLPANQDTLKISEKLNIRMTRNFSNCSEYSCDVNLFDELAEEAMIGLETRIFRDFLDSNTWEEYIDKNPDILLDIGKKEKEKDLSNFAIFQDRKKLEKLEFSPGYFMTNDDFLNYFSLLSEELWNETEKSQGFTSCTSKDLFSVDTKGIHLIKEQGFIPFNATQIFHAYCSSMKGLHKGLSDISQLEFSVSKESQKVSSAVCLLKYNLNSFQARDFVVAFSTKFVDTNTVILMGKSVEHEKAPVDPKYVRGSMNFCLIIETKPLVNLSKVTFISHIDLKGKINFDAYNKALVKRKLGFLPKLLEIIMKRQETKEKPPQEHYGILETFEKSAGLTDDEDLKSKMKEAYFNSIFGNSKAMKSIVKGEDDSLQNTITNLMGNSKVKRKFKKFCEKEWSLENLLLFDEIEKFSKIKNKRKKVSKMKEIYTMFFSEQSNLEVNIDFKTRGKLDETMKNLSVDTNIDAVFEETLNEIKRNLRDTMNRFLFSEDFKCLNVKVVSNEKE